MDMKVQMYLKKVREGGGVVLTRIAMAAARGIVLTCDRSLLVKFGGHVELIKHWAYSLLHRMKFVQRKVTTAKSKHTKWGLRLSQATLGLWISKVPSEWRCVEPVTSD